MSNLDLEKIRDLIYRKTGMRFPEQKDYFIKSRIDQRLQDLGVSDYDKYVKSLLREEDKREFQHFLEKITINETYFFRDFPQLQGFAENVVPEYLDQKRKNNDYKLKIWSAACSTGEEAYTLSIIFNEILEDFKKWEIEIVATDIDRMVLNHAQTGIYSARSLKDTPVIYTKKYFSKEDKGFRISKTKTIPVDFFQLNLSDRLAMRKMRGFDFVFCRNVLIYFDEDSRKQVVNQLYDALLPQGYLFLGHSESVGRITAIFKLKNIGGFLCYQKP